MKTPPNKWKWFGNAGHFICGRYCRFHLTTKVGKYLVSTVGEYVHPSHSNGSETEENKYLLKNPLGEDIGYGRKFETMVFKAGKICNVPECGCGLPEISGSEIDFNGYNSRRDATLGHLEMCNKYSE